MVVTVSQLFDSSSSTQVKSRVCVKFPGVCVVYVFCVRGKKEVGFSFRLKKKVFLFCLFFCEIVLLKTHS